MSQFIALAQGDFRQIFRDRTLLIFLFVPFILLAVVRSLVPYLTAQYPIVENYHVLVMMLVGVQTSVIFGFIVAFLILEEKDEQVLQVIRVLPISPSYFILYRVLFATIFSTVSAYIVIRFSGIAFPGEVNTALLAIQYGLVAPFIALLVATFAANKVEGMAFFKGVNLFLLLPIVTFFIKGIWQYAFAVIPTFWTYSFYEKSVEAAAPNVVWYLSGLVVYALAIVLVFLRFKGKVFDR
ncbi:MAG: hypothetical protein AAGI23_00230 [Bacteroidota bacterium]